MALNLENEPIPFKKIEDVAEAIPPRKVIPQMSEENQCKENEGSTDDSVNAAMVKRAALKRKDFRISHRNSFHQRSFYYDEKKDASIPSSRDEDCASPNLRFVTKLAKKINEKQDSVCSDKEVSISSSEVLTVGYRALKETHWRENWISRPYVYL